MGCATIEKSVGVAECRPCLTDGSVKAEYHADTRDYVIVVHWPEAFKDYSELSTEEAEKVMLILKHLRDDIREVLSVAKRATA